MFCNIFTALFASKILSLSTLELFAETEMQKQTPGAVLPHLTAVARQQVCACTQRRRHWRYHQRSSSDPGLFYVFTKSLVNVCVQNCLVQSLLELVSYPMSENALLIADFLKGNLLAIESIKTFICSMKSAIRINRYKLCKNHSY